MKKPFCYACEKNQAPILDVLRDIIGTRRATLLEIGSGTGQHAVYMAPHFPTLTWVTSDVLANHPGINAWLNEAAIENIQGPLALDVGKDTFPTGIFDFVYTANTFHIMSLEKINLLITWCAAHLQTGSYIIVYGPFNYNGKYTSPGNAEFDKLLKQKDPLSGIREFEVICNTMESNHFTLHRDYPMPANNRALVFIAL